MTTTDIHPATRGGAMSDRIPDRLSWPAGGDVAGTSPGMVDPPERGSQVHRRVFLKGVAGLAGLPLVSRLAAPAGGVAVPPAGGVRPGEPGWPGAAEWAKLREAVGGRLVPVESPFAACTPDPGSPACTDLFQHLRNPFYIGDSVALTETLGWTDAWTSRTSAYAMLAQSSADVAAAVNFAREHRVRLVVKGGGHSYVGGSHAPDSLLIWTRPNMRAVQLHDRLCPGAPQAWHRRGEPAGGGGRHPRWGGAHRQRGQQPGPVLGTQGRRGRDLRGRHPADAAHPSAAGLRRCGPHHDRRSVGRRPCDAGRAGEAACRAQRQPAPCAGCDGCGRRWWLTMAGRRGRHVRPGHGRAWRSPPAAGLAAASGRYGARCNGRCRAGIRRTSWVSRLRRVLQPIRPGNPRRSMLTG